jgi:hypothetical protein
MYKIDISVRCPDGSAEVLANEPETTACIVEASVSVALVELFGQVIVDAVRVEYLSPQDERDQQLRPAA